MSDDLRDYDERMGGPNDSEAEALREEGRREILREIKAKFDHPWEDDYRCMFCGEGVHTTDCLWVRADKAE